MTERDDLEDGLRALARLLAPYLREELGIGPDEPVSAPMWDEAGAAEFVAGLKPEVVDRALELFHALARPPHSIDAPRLAERLGAGSPREIAGLLTTPLKRRASATGHPIPWQERRLDGRTVWSDRNGSATQISKALQRASAAHRSLRLEAGELVIPNRPNPVAVSVYRPINAHWDRSGADRGSCLADTRPGDRIAIYRSETEPAIVALFDVGTDPAWNDEYRWVTYGYTHVLEQPVSRDELLKEPGLAKVFERIQGRRRLSADNQAALGDLIALRQAGRVLPDLILDTGPAPHRVVAQEK